MSHLKERSEKNCLNCGTALYGRYCHVCGQENLEPRETVWHLVSHFFQDITHFDGKFFSTVKYLLTKPGFLSKEYMMGRRASYLNPIRMYVFTSAFFFLILFSLPNEGNIMSVTETPGKTEARQGLADWQKSVARLQGKLKKQTDRRDSAEMADDISELQEKITAVRKIYGDTSARTFTEKEISLVLLRANLDSLKKAGMPSAVLNNVDHALGRNDSTAADSSIEFSGKKYRTPQQYDSIQAGIPKTARDGWFKHFMKRRLITINLAIHKDKLGFYEHFRENFLHWFPKVLFISLPFFALILKLVYVRRKQFYYTSHGIFAIHFYCATFLFLMVLIIGGQLYNEVPWEWLKAVFSFLGLGIWIGILIYLYRAMRKFYNQGRGKTLLKFCVAGLLAFIVNLTLLAVFTIISAITVK